jgi:large subunit ribosomal protein L23
MTDIHNILIRPIITEKSNYQAGTHNQYVFEVARDASKGSIKDAVEILFDVEVLKVNVINVSPKRSVRWQSRRVKVRRSAYKKAIITLVPGDSIEAFEGVR